ncbi:MAG: protein-L-isoaspartate(D-aspartate) O-methyltransferase [Hyphomicrobiaceae bacterium]
MVAKPDEDGPGEGPGPVRDDAAGKARAALVASLRRRGISDERVLAAIAQVPREAFVPAALAAEAYLDVALPIDCEQTISQPYVVALMTEALDVQPQHKVLEIGTGSGYQTAILSKLCRQVCTIERYQALTRNAERLFRQLALSRIRTRTGDGYRGWPDEAPFDRIIVTAAAPQVPEQLVAELAPFGVMVAPVGLDTESQVLVRISRRNGEVGKEELLKVRFVPMVEGLPEAGEGTASES